MKKLIVLCLLCQAVWAAEFEGIAPLGLDGLAAARVLAVQDALENAALFNGAQVTSLAVKKAGQWGETSKISGTPQGQYQLLREWQSNGFLHVLLDIAPPAPMVSPLPTKPVASTRRNTARQVERCDLDDLRRKVLISHFWIEHPAQTQDLDRFSEGIQIELVRQLYDSQQFLPQRAPNVAVFDVLPQFVDPLLQPERVRALAQQYSVQFIVGGIVRDTTLLGERYTLAYGSDLRPYEKKSVASLPILNFAQVGVKAVPAARRFDLELFVFDGVSGALVNRHRIAGQASGEVVQNLSSALGTAGFAATDYGRLVTDKLKEAGTLVSQDLSCIPFSARITRVEKNTVYIDAGYTSNMRPGDTLQVYRVSPTAMPIDSANFAPTMRLGMPEQKGGTFTVQQVQPLFAMGKIDGLTVEPGDYVRFVGPERNND
ncbi:flagellar assembly protein FlgT [Deefgea salmonis]|uniref:Flagellar assembly protein FlgT n=1 Tax=Deefgea salmonis TaxID=2875502 RepID=A0ABS8BII4_9NEIS|nr:flagellar assembly protein FlgT [Deefgea salmonis]MCB5195530.1 flagellar assembly protein FlgT [Deefgea salmonis]